MPFGLFIPPDSPPDAAAARRTLTAIEDRLAATPGVEIAGARRAGVERALSDGHAAPVLVRLVFL